MKVLALLTAVLLGDLILQTLAAPVDNSESEAVAGEAVSASLPAKLSSSVTLKEKKVVLDKPKNQDVKPLTPQQQQQLDKQQTLQKQMMQDIIDRTVGSGKGGIKAQGDNGKVQPTVQVKASNGNLDSTNNNKQDDKQDDKTAHPSPKAKASGVNPGQPNINSVKPASRSDHESAAANPGEGPRVAKNTGIVPPGLFSGTQGTPDDQGKKTGQPSESQGSSGYQKNPNKGSQSQYGPPSQGNSGQSHGKPGQIQNNPSAVIQDNQGNPLQGQGRPVSNQANHGPDQGNPGQDQNDGFNQKIQGHLSHFQGNQFQGNSGNGTLKTQAGGTQGPSNEGSNPNGPPPSAGPEASVLPFRIGVVEDPKPVPTSASNSPALPIHFTPLNQNASQGGGLSVFPAKLEPVSGGPQGNGNEGPSKEGSNPNGPPPSAEPVASVLPIRIGIVEDPKPVSTSASNSPALPIHFTPLNQNASQDGGLSVFPAKLEPASGGPQGNGSQGKSSNDAGSIGSIQVISDVHNPLESSQVTSSQVSSSQASNPVPPRIRPDSQGSVNQGPEDQGPNSQGPPSQGTINPEPDTKGPGIQGPQFGPGPVKLSPSSSQEAGASSSQGSDQGPPQINPSSVHSQPMIPVQGNQANQTLPLVSVQDDLAHTSSIQSQPLIPVDINQANQDSSQSQPMIAVLGNQTITGPRQSQPLIPVQGSQASPQSQVSSQQGPPPSPKDDLIFGSAQADANVNVKTN